MGEIKNIYEKMLLITDEIGKIEKKLKVDTGGGRGYKAVGEVDILEAVKPLEKKYLVYSYPYHRTIICDKETQTKSGTINQFVRVETTYRFVNVEDPTDYLQVVSYGDGVDSQDKAVGKAMTYCDKYALMKAYKIATGDDPDQFASEEQRTYVKPKQINGYQLTLLESLDISIKERLCNKFNVDSLSQLNESQAELAIQSLKKTGAIKDTKEELGF